MPKQALFEKSGIGAFGLAAESGLGVPKGEERTEAWKDAIQRHRQELGELGISTPEMKEIGVQGFNVEVDKSDDTIAMRL